MLFIYVFRNSLEAFLGGSFVEDLSRYASKMVLKSPPIIKLVCDISGINAKTFGKNTGLSVLGAYIRGVI